MQIITFSITKAEIIDFLITLVTLYENRDDINNREFEKCTAAKRFLYKLK